MDNPLYDIKATFPSLLNYYGIIAGLAYALPYSLVGLFMGSLADKYNRKYMFASTVAFGGITSLITGT